MTTTRSDGTRLVVLPPFASEPSYLSTLGLGRIGVRDVGWATYPGQAGSPRRPGMAFPDIADEIAETLESPVDIVAIALGTSVAAQLLLRHPDRIRSAILVCTGFLPALDETGRQQLIDRAAAAERDGMESIVDETLDRWFTPRAIQLGHPGVATARRQILALSPEAWSDLWLAGLPRESVADDAVRAMPQPMSLVVPLHDATAGGALLRGLHELLGRSRLHFVDGPHMMHLERPRNLLAAIDQHYLWLDSGAPRIETPVYSSGEEA